MKTVLKLTFVLLILGMGFFGFGQSKRVQAVPGDGTGVTISAVAPADTSLVWHHPDGGSYVWDVGTQTWQPIKYNFEVDSVGAIALKVDRKGA